jgi:RNA polymerase sigma-70 factor (ECF subfamily)
VVTAAAHHPAPSDLDLLRSASEGDGEAFETLVRRHQDRVLAVCQRLLGDREEARDAAQEVFLKVYRKAGGFRPRAKVSTWLYRIAVNHCLNRLRRRKVVRFLSFGALARGARGARGVGASEAGGAGVESGASASRGDAPPFDPTDPAPGPETALDTRRRWAAARRAIDRLPDTQRAVVVLAKLEGLSYEEIARVLGITTGSVASRLFRAMRQLEKALPAEHPSDGPQDGGSRRVS